MPLDCAVVGRPAGERTHAVTVRQCLAYAAGTDDLNPRYLDDARPGGVIAPPLFGVRLDWPLRPALTAISSLTRGEAARGVHATHDMRFHRPILPGDQLTVRGLVVQAEMRPPGAFLVVRYTTVDAAGDPVLTVYYGSLFRGVGITGEPHAIDEPPPLPTSRSGAGTDWQAEVAVAPHAAHVYTECADIYNPIHTERAAALGAGLPDIIIHGTLTLAYAVRELVDREAAGDGARLRRVACRFSGMVLPGTTIRVQADAGAQAHGARDVGFSVLDAEGKPAIRDGVAVIAD